MGAYVNERGRIQCGDHQFFTGECVAVWMSGEWVETRIEFDHEAQAFYSVDGLDLIGQEVRRHRSDGDYRLD